MNTYDILIIGAGPAGLSAAIYARRANKSVLVLESIAPGGQILQTEHIENYPGLPHVSGKDLAKSLAAQAKDLGAELKIETAVEISHPEPKVVSEKKIGGALLSIGVQTIDESSVPRFQVETDLGNFYGAQSIILAVGTTYRKLNLPGEKELIGHGISFCATCDGALYKNKSVAVYGGGNSALYSALHLSDLAKSVHIIHRRKQFRADEALVEKAAAVKNIEFVMDATVSDFVTTGAKSATVLSGLKLSNGETLDVSALFVTIGREPADAELCENSSDIEIDHVSDDYIRVEEDLATSEKGIFAAGDCRDKDLRQIVTAVSDGALAATSAIDFLND